MKITDKKVDRAGAVARERLVIPLPTAISQTGVRAFSYTPGYAFTIKRVRSFCRVKAGTIAGVLKVATRTAVAAVSFTTDTEVGQTLSSTKADIKGTAAEAINLEYTSDGSGALTNGHVIVEIVPTAARK